MAQKKIADIIDDDTLSVDLGEHAYDEVTGFNGKVTAVVFNISEQPRVCLEFINSGKLETEWFSASRVKSAPTPKGDALGPN